MYDTSPAAWVIVGSKDADTVDGKHATDFVSAVDVVTAAEANKILKLDANGKLPANITGDANTVDGKNPGNGAGNILLLDTNARVPISNLSPIVGVAASKTFALTDAQTVQNCTNAAAITITIPTNATVAFAVGTELAIVRQGAGTVAIAPAAGVTLNSKDAKRSIDGQYASCALKKTATDTWLLVGALA
jgi:hypothetical protein